MKSSSPDRGCQVDVVYVLKRNAKTAKSALEAANLLNKHFRMVPADPDVAKGCIALPVSITFGVSLDGPWKECVVGRGSQICPYSTAVLGNRRQLTRGSENCKDLTLVQRAIVQTHQALKSSDVHQMALDALLDGIEQLNSSICPKKLEIFGDDRTLVVPPHSFEGQQFHSLLCTDLKVDQAYYLAEFWKQLAQVHGSPRIARRGVVDPNSRIRESGHRLLFPTSSIPESTGPGSPGWIQVTEQGVRQSFDMTRVMFSRGNISEKIRFGKLVKEGDMILDMYTGIGYYTLPALIRGRASHVYACEWNEHAANALRYNIKDNHVEDRVTVLEGDCRKVAQEHNLVNMFDRISLGLLPSSEGGWRTAVRGLKEASGGWLHIHGNVPVKEVDAWVSWVCYSLHVLCSEEGKPENWAVLCDHVEKVKSFAPTVAHYVADVFFGVHEHHPRGEDMHGAKAGVILGNNFFLPCPAEAEPPSCALSSEGALFQDWMR